MGRTAMVVAAVAMLLGGLSGCGDDPKPKIAHSADPSPTATTSSAGDSSTDVAPPPMPDAATRHTVAGGRAFASYYFEVANYAQQTLDIAPFRRLFDASCSACRGGAQGLQAVADGGGVIKGGETSLSRIRASSTNVAGEGWVTVRFHYEISRQTIDYPGKKKDQASGPGGGNSFLVLKPVATGWVVTYWEIK